nr:hypothetical protein [Pleurocapsa sp. CCALA 161]
MTSGIFKPSNKQIALVGKPVVVLSNNDGCPKGRREASALAYRSAYVVARSQEVKDLGVKMGVPVFKIKKLITQHQSDRG